MNEREDREWARENVGDDEYLFWESTIENRRVWEEWQELEGKKTTIDSDSRKSENKWGYE